MRRAFVGAGLCGRWRGTIKIGGCEVLGVRRAEDDKAGRGARVRVGEPVDSLEEQGSALEGGGIVVSEDAEDAQARLAGVEDIAENGERVSLVSGVVHEVARQGDEVGGGLLERLKKAGDRGAFAGTPADVQVADMEDCQGVERGRERGVREFEGVDRRGGVRSAEPRGGVVRICRHRA